MNKNQKASLLGLFTLSLALVACSGQKGQNAVSASDSVAANTLTVGQTVSVDSSASYLSWKGFKPGGQHYGKLPVSAGELDLKDRLCLYPDEWYHRRRPQGRGWSR